MVGPARMAFWASVGAILYVYVGYPLLLLLLGSLRGAGRRVPEGERPRVSLVVSAYNEDGVIRDKILNSLALDYPRDRLEIVVASDGSTDGTASIAREYGEAVRVFHYPTRRGKNAVLNDVVPLVQGDIVVFTDANGKFAADAVSQLVRHFADPAVGCVCGELVYASGDENLVARGYNVYWRFDQVLKSLESRLGCLLGANGSIFAVRKALYRPLRGDVANDMVLPVQIAARGYRVIYEPQAVSVEAGSRDAAEELGRRSRIVGRGLMGVRVLLPDVLRGRRWLLLWELVSRKLLRYCTPFLFLALAASSAVLATGVYAWALAAQAAFYAAAAASFVASWCGARIRALSVPHYFVVGNAAALMGWVKVLTGCDLTKWETVERSYDRQIRAPAGAPRMDPGR